MNRLQLLCTLCLPLLVACRCDLGVEIKFAQDKSLTRDFLLNGPGKTKPVLIKGITKNWQALKTWDRKNIIRLHGDVPYRADPWRGNVTVRQVLGGLDGNDGYAGEYPMGHVVQYGDCYMARGREYSPFLQTRAKKDYVVPDYLQPMKTFQIGLGRGRGVGVSPEHHPSSWFAVIVGRKRWVLTPGSETEDHDTDGDGVPEAPGPEPTMSDNQNKKTCTVSQPKLRKDALVCDQEPGDIMWVPWFWWHETCGLDEWNVGIGGITYEGAEEFEKGCREPQSFTQAEMEQAHAKCNGCLDAATTAAGGCAKVTGLSWCKPTASSRHKSDDKPAPPKTKDDKSVADWLNKEVRG